MNFATKSVIVVVLCAGAALGASIGNLDYEYEMPVHHRETRQAAAIGNAVGGLVSGLVGAGVGLIPGVGGILSGPISSLVSSGISGITGALGNRITPFGDFPMIAQPMMFPGFGGPAVPYPFFRELPLDGFY